MKELCDGFMNAFGIFLFWVIIGFTIFCFRNWNYPTKDISEDERKEITFKKFSGFDLMKRNTKIKEIIRFFRKLRMMTTKYKELFRDNPKKWIFLDFD